MTIPEMMAIGAVLLSALAILPGTLGILMFTNRVEASASGARLIYFRAMWLLVAAILLMAYAAFEASGAGGFSLLFKLSALAFAGVLGFGFFMHTKLLFQPIKKPIFISLDHALEKFGPDEEVVGIIDDDGNPWAFVARLARRPHIVYQPSGDAPFLMTHCILAHSSMAYALEGKFANPDISITAALSNNMVFYEKTNQCSVIQMHNQSRDGALPLRTVPTVACSLAAWKALYPQSKVWMRNIEWRDIFYLKLLARADVIDPKSPVMVYPLQHPQDNRLGMKSNVNGVYINGEAKAYPIAASLAERLIHDEVGGTPLLVIAAQDADFIQVYDRRVGERTLSFKSAEGPDNMVDNETGSEWSPTGQCIGGELSGARLTPIAHYNKIFWYVWSDYHPGSAIYGAETTPELTETAA